MIADCATCLSLPQRLELDYERGDTRPSSAAALVTVWLKQGESESREAWSQSSLERCPVCGTAYYVSRSKDEGHSFMDPTHDSESITRLSSEAARAQGVIPTITIAELETLLAHDNWHLRKYAINSLVDAWHGVDQLIAHPKMTVRAEGAYDLMYLAMYANEWWIHRIVTPATRERARAIAPEVLRAATSVLRAPSEPSLYYSTDSYRPGSTHATAADTLWIAAVSGVAFADDDIDLLLEMLRGEEAVRFHANSALLTLTRVRPELIERVRAAVVLLPQAVREDYNVRRLVEQVKA